MLTCTDASVITCIGVFDSHLPFHVHFDLHLHFHFHLYLFCLFFQSFFNFFFSIGLYFVHVTVIFFIVHVFLLFDFSFFFVLKNCSFWFLPLMNLHLCLCPSQRFVMDGANLDQSCRSARSCFQCLKHRTMSISLQFKET